MTVYLAKNTINNKKYVGITSGNLEGRKRQHKCNALTRNQESFFSRAIRKHGWENFEWSVLDSSAATFEELLILEKRYIIDLDTFRNGYNMTEGGDGTLGYQHSEKSKEKISNSSKGKKRSPISEETKKKIGKARKGKSFEEIFGIEESKKIKNKMSASSQEFHRTNEDHKKWLEKSLNDKFGTEKAQIIKRKMSDTRKKNLVNGKRTDITKEGKDGMRNAKLGHNNPNYKEISEDARLKIEEFYKNNPRLTKDFCLSLGLSLYLVRKYLKESNLWR